MIAGSMLAAPSRAPAPFRAASRPGAQRRAVALPLRRRLPPAAAAGATAADQQSALAQLVASGAKPTKTAVSKLTVAELRAECQLLGLPADGLKAALVERLLGWWEAQRQQPAAAQPAQQEQPAAAPPAAGAGAAAGEPAAAPPSSSAEDAGERQQQVEAQRRAEIRRYQQEQQEQQQQQQLAGQGQESDEEEGQRQARQQRKRVPGVPWMTVTWLGTSSGNPTPKRNVSAIAVQYGDDMFLVDAGEGTRHQMRRNRTPMDPGRVRAMLITHTHGDHCFGLGGMIEAICQARLGTELQHDPVRIYGPKELQSLVAFSIRAGGTPLTTPIIVTGFVLDPALARPPTKVDASGMLLFELQGPDAPERLAPDVASALPELQQAYDAGSEDVVQPGLTWTLRIPGGVRVAAAQLQHRVPCWGYVFQEPHTRLAGPPDDGAAAGAEQGNDGSGDDESNGASSQQAQQLAQQAQQAQQQQGQQQWVRRGRKLVILGDTCDSKAIAPLAVGCDLLSHEATFCSGMEAKADVAQHSTTLMAGAFAAQVAARLLVLTHFSARYESVSGHAQAMKRERKDIRKAELRATAYEQGGLYDELKRLWNEAFETYGKPTIRLANDFTYVNVPPPEPVTVEELKQEEMRLQREAAAARQHGVPQPAGGAQWERPQGGQREQYGRSREQYGRQREQQGGREQYGQRRQGRQDGRPSYDRARGGSGGQQRRGGNRQQRQWQPRTGGGAAGDVRQWPDN